MNLWDVGSETGVNRQFDYNYSLLYIYSYFCYILASFFMLLCCILDVYLSFCLFVQNRQHLFPIPHPVGSQVGYFFRRLYIYIIYIRLKIKPNSVRIRFLSCQFFVLPSTGFDLTPLIHCSTNPYIYIYVIKENT